MALKFTTEMMDIMGVELDTEFYEEVGKIIISAPGEVYDGVEQSIVEITGKVLGPNSIPTELVSGWVNDGPTPKNLSKGITKELTQYHYKHVAREFGEAKAIEIKDKYNK